MRRLKRGRAMTAVSVVCPSFALILLGACLATLAQTSSLQTIRVIGGGMPLRVAQMNGLLAKYGIEAQTSAMANSDSMPTWRPEGPISRTPLSTTPSRWSSSQERT
jgi:hypothetical protein